MFGSHHGQLPCEHTAQRLTQIVEPLTRAGAHRNHRAAQFGRQTVLRSMTPVRCRRGGLLHLHAGLGSELAEGQLVATVTNPFGDVVEEIAAPHAGPLVRITTFPTVTSGERVAQIGVLR